MPQDGRERRTGQAQPMTTASSLLPSEDCTGCCLTPFDNLEDYLVKAEKLNSWLSLGANVGVVIGLVLLILEIQQNTDMMETQINQSRSESAMSSLEAGFNSDYMPAIRVTAERGEPLSREEMLRYNDYFRAFNRNMDNQLWQYTQGFLGANIPRSVRDGVREVIGGTTIGLETWEGQRVSYTDEYIAFVDEALADLREQR